MELNSLTDIGVKRKDNQDNYWSARLDINGKEAGVLCLCDGMGGLDNGGLASKVVVEAVRNFFKDRSDFINLIGILKGVNSSLYNKSTRENISLGTTCTIVFCYEGIYQILHIGDSRCYKKSIKDGKVSLLSKDHTVMEKLRSEGKVLPAHLARKYKNTLIRCIGVSNNIEFDYSSGSYDEGDLFLVCSDGFWHYLEERSFFNEDFSNLQELIRTYISKGETDNISVSILKC